MSARHDANGGSTGGDRLLAEAPSVDLSRQYRRRPPGTMTKSCMIKGVAAALVIGGAVAAFAVIRRPAIPAIEPPSPQSFDAALVRRGRVLAAIGNCNDCHTVRGGSDFGGGFPVPTPFGTIEHHAGR